MTGTVPQPFIRHLGDGLVRAQFEVVHRWCLDLNLPIQAITSIPCFSRSGNTPMPIAGRKTRKQWPC